jgi:cobyrinic acid a,c-diamide synthase
VLTLGLLRHLARIGVDVASAKAGPDYIDPAFHAAASGCGCLTLDPWAMAPARLRTIAADLAHAASIVICEGVMGLFDGATARHGSTADIAALTGWPVVLVIDARAQSASAAAVLRGFAGHRGGVEVAGVVFNRVGSDRHAEILREACADAVPQIPVLGCLPRRAELALPERHLGLVQAAEHPDLARFLDHAAELVATHLDVPALTQLARPLTAAPAHDRAAPPIPPLGQRIAVASDVAFAFRYPHLLDGWRDAGAELIPFSPLNDEPPDAAANAVYLPGGYPELHAGRLAGNTALMTGLRAAAARGAVIFGECGGYMLMGRALIDGDGTSHRMAGLLPVVTSMAKRRLHLGYRQATLTQACALGPAGCGFRGH